MAAVGKVTVKKVGDDVIVSDASGTSFLIKGRGDRPTLDLDPRIDLTKPIWEQAQKLAVKDRAAAARAKKRKRIAKAA
jgi:hypothetical protein